MPSILIGGDICPIGGNTPYFAGGDAHALFHDLLPLFSAADLVVANLECPLVDVATPIAKTGPCFGESTACINGITAAGVDVLCLANNHILDHGEPGLRSTLTACLSAGVTTVGAGPDLEAARQVLIKDVGGTKVAIVAMAEHEFSIATRSTAGANPLDEIGFVRWVRAAEGSYDVLIVLLHGGPEFLEAPPPRLRNTCRFLVEMGADVVVVQHPHSLGGRESYAGGDIIYGQGALVMDEAIYRERRSFHEAVLVRVLIDQHRISGVELLPILQSSPVPGARLMADGASALFLRALEDKSRRISDDDYIEAEWRRFCDEHKHAYISVLLGHNRLLRLANRHGHITRWLTRSRRLLGSRNVVCCESHREAIETIFRDRLI